MVLTALRREMLLPRSWPLAIWIICWTGPSWDNTSHWDLVCSFRRKSKRRWAATGIQTVVVALKITPGGSPGLPTLFLIINVASSTFPIWTISHLCKVAQTPAQKLRVIRWASLAMLFLPPGLSTVTQKNYMYQIEFSLSSSCKYKRLNGHCKNIIQQQQ